MAVGSGYEDLQRIAEADLGIVWMLTDICLIENCALDVVMESGVASRLSGRRPETFAVP